MFNEKKSAIVTCVIALFIAIALPLIVFNHEFAVVKANEGLFFPIWLILAILAGISSVFTIATADDPRVGNGIKMIPVVTCIILAIWAFGWCAEQRSRASEKIKGETSYLIK